jgi:tRNA uridine 5-carboxymethylaminomethyl modification enzyme
MPMARELGILDDVRYEQFERKMECWNVDVLRWKRSRCRLQRQDGTGFRSVRTANAGMDFSFWRFRISASTIFGRFCPGLDSVPPEALEQLEIDALYATYVERQERDVQALARDEAHAIPETLDYNEMTGLSAELRSKLLRVRPRTLAQAGRIDGMTPAALALILTHLRRDGRKSA